MTTYNCYLTYTTPQINVLLFIHRCVHDSKGKSQQHTHHSAVHILNESSPKAKRRDTSIQQGTVSSNLFNHVHASGEIKSAMGVESRRPFKTVPLDYSLFPVFRLLLAGVFVPPIQSLPVETSIKHQSLELIGPLVANETFRYVQRVRSSF